MSMLNEAWSDDFTLSCYYTPPRPADEQCEDSPAEGGTHVVDRTVSDDCVNCKREVET